MTTLDIVDIEPKAEPLFEYDPAQVCQECWQLRSLKGTCACL